MKNGSAQEEVDFEQKTRGQPFLRKVTHISISSSSQNKWQFFGHVTYFLELDSKLG